MQQFIFTNRAIVKKRGVEQIDTSDSCGNTQNLRFGYLDVSKKKVALIPDPDIVKEHGIESYETIDYKDSKQKGSSEWFNRIYAEMKEDKEKNDTLVFIHGFYCGFKCFISNMEHLVTNYVDNPESSIGRVVGFCWPSNNNLLQYKNDREDAHYAGAALARGWIKLMQFFSEFVGVDNQCGKNIHLLAHSLGNAVFEKMIASVLSSRYSSFGQVFKEVVLAAPDIQHDAFEKGNPLYHINDFCERVHVYTHKSDDALRISKYTKNFESRLGKNGPVRPFHIPSNVSIVDCSLIKDQRSIKEKLFDHWYYKNSQTVIDDIGLVLNGADSFENRNYIANQNKFILKP